MQAHEFRDPVFKGCTRPAMKFGVPIVPLIVVGSLVAIFAQLTTVLALGLIFPIVVVMGQITRSDDQKYRLLWLRFYCRIIHLNRTAKFWNASTYAPVNYRKTR